MVDGRVLVEAREKRGYLRKLRSSDGILAFQTKREVCHPHKDFIFQRVGWADGIVDGLASISYHYQWQSQQIGAFLCIQSPQYEELVDDDEKFVLRFQRVAK